MLDQLRSYYSFLKPQSGVYQYMPFNNAPTNRSRTRIALITGAYIIAALSVSALFVHPVEKARQYGTFQPTDTSSHGSIPSIVHYVQIKKDEKSVLKFPFSSFLNICAAVLYIKPERIYIHTDFTPSEISEAGEKGDRWTKSVINTFADLVIWNQHINAIQHKSDFLRWEAVEKTGGIYMDWDVFPLRPLTPLLTTGFAFIGGRHYGGAGEHSGINGTINNGVFMTKPNSTMARIVVREQHAGFNGEWAANLQSMTNVAERLVPIPYEVLILDRTAFAPTHWFRDSTDPLFQPNDDKPASPVPERTNSTGPMEIYEVAIKNRRRRAEWEMDFSSTYMLHAFALGEYHKYVNPKTILSRKSNFGIATYDTVRHMADMGYVGEHDEE
ncbi:hypothetical protein COCMIDRAFT_40217 [Bipolaris oryzae ATCC 44560]|uniref:Glycosyltransferase family 32 protein n=1 Tax=Bipolaris oryzae ATCC 44560 TaxID=930090 RepID=W6YVT1_COCMI|nr:uncharacterized protein COCMIDRAFT_40217 [Bipolaris oryzae ATCC 44560]EUC41638.1 hypothetical protein COCMIDRAFT_40217 [Bipolaris oryzae ATCC 44560]